MALALPARQTGRADLLDGRNNGAMAVHSQLLSCCAAEVHAMVEGAMRHGTPI